jgi:hypothetical protein
VVTSGATSKIDEPGGCQPSSSSTRVEDADRVHTAVIREAAGRL